MNRSEQRIQNNKIRRNHERRKNVTLFVLTLCMVITLSVSINSFLSNAKTNTDDITYKYYKSIVVQQGDTLWSLATDNMPKDKSAYIEEVKQMNHLKDDCITAGSYLIVPYYSGDFVMAP